MGGSIASDMSWGLGGAYYKALRAHFLVDAALCLYMLQKQFSENELKDMERFITRCIKEQATARIGLLQQNSVAL